jgi:hypothetical protein
MGENTSTLDQKAQALKEELVKPPEQHKTNIRFNVSRNQFKDINRLLNQFKGVDGRTEETSGRIIS